MNYSIQPKIYTKLKGSIYAITSLILISFIFFAIKYNETSSQKREETLSKILKNNYFLELNKLIFQQVSSPYLNIAHKIKKVKIYLKFLKVTILIKKIFLKQIVNLKSLLSSIN